MRKGPLVLAVVALAGVVSLAGPQQEVRRLDGSSISSDEIDRTVARLMKAAEVPGLGLAVIDSGEIAYLKTYGVRDKEKNLPETVDSAVYAASFTKVAFAYIVMQLVDKGRLDLDKPVYQYLPKSLPAYPNYTYLADDPRYKRITARMLLSHTSGFPNWRAFEDDRKLKIHFEPGSRYAYSGEGLVLLQLVVETITQQPLEELMQQYVFRPLGMTRTSLVWQDRFESDYAIGYDEYGRPLGAEKRKKADAAGSMNTTLRDFARFMQAVLKGEGLSKQMHWHQHGTDVCLERWRPRLVAARAPWRRRLRARSHRGRSTGFQSRLCFGVEHLQPAACEVFRTSDGGRTWQTLPAMHGQSIRAMAMFRGNSNVLVTGSLNGVYRTNDGGNTWEHLSSNSSEIKNIKWIAVDPKDQNTIMPGPGISPGRPPTPAPIGSTLIKE